MWQRSTIRSTLGYRCEKTRSTRNNIKNLLISFLIYRLTVVDRLKVSLKYMNSFFSKQMTVVDRALNMCKMIFWVQININREKSPWTNTPILIHILKTAVMLTTGHLAQMVGALMNDVTMKLMQGFDSYCFFVLFCFVLILFVCLFLCLLLLLGFFFFFFGVFPFVIVLSLSLSRSLFQP